MRKSGKRGAAEFMDGHGSGKGMGGARGCRMGGDGNGGGGSRMGA